MHSEQGYTGDRLTTVEHEVYDSLIAEGLKVYRSGWPDFLVVHPDGSLVFLEVKGPMDDLRPSQKAMLSALETAGLQTEIKYVGIRKKPQEQHLLARVECPGCGLIVCRNKRGGTYSHLPCGYKYSDDPLPILGPKPTQRVNQLLEQIRSSCVKYGYPDLCSGNGKLQITFYTGAY